MFAARDQENLTNAHRRTAASKPLNQAFQPKTPGAQAFKTPFKAQNNENLSFATGKVKQNTFQTPAPQDQPRIALGEKTGNAKAFQTPGPLNQQPQTQKRSSARRTIKKKIYVAPEPTLDSPVKEQDDPEDEEPDYGYLPPDPIPLPDPDMEFDYDQSFPQFLPENMNRGVGEVYFQSPKCEKTGRSLSLIKEEEIQRKAMEDEIERCLRLDEEVYRNRADPDEEVQRMIAAGPISQQEQKPKVHESRVDTLKS
ncbi:hypothetical protein LTR66_015775, partial [Elasticomyces elasticus]